MSIKIERETIEKCIVTVPGKEYDSFMNKRRWLQLLCWSGFALCFGLMMWLIMSLSVQTWGWGLLAIVVWFFATIAISIATELRIDSKRYALITKYGWDGKYPFRIRPDYQTFLHD